jgi:hypothetical protein
MTEFANFIFPFRDNVWEVVITIIIYLVVIKAISRAIRKII